MQGFVFYIYMITEGPKQQKTWRQVSDEGRTEM